MVSPGCASARNYGRMMSDASHIAFVDADDLPDAGLFPGLLELARQTGLDHAETFQAGRSLLNLLLPLVIVSLLIKIGDG